MEVFNYSCEEIVRCIQYFEFVRFHLSKLWNFVTRALSLHVVSVRQSRLFDLNVLMLYFVYNGGTWTTCGQIDCILCWSVELKCCGVLNGVVWLITMYGPLYGATLSCPSVVEIQNFYRHCTWMLLYMYVLTFIREFVACYTGPCNLRPLHFKTAHLYFQYKYSSLFYNPLF